MGVVCNWQATVAVGSRIYWSEARLRVVVCMGWRNRDATAMVIAGRRLEEIAARDTRSAKLRVRSRRARIPR